MVLLCSMCFKSNNQISQTLSITQLTKHHCKQLISLCEMIHIAVSIILVNQMANLLLSINSINWAKTYLLCSSCSIIDNCKSTNSNRCTLEISCKRLYFNQFKERLVHFNGTVVISLLFSQQASVANVIPVL